MLNHSGVREAARSEMREAEKEGEGKSADNTVVVVGRGT